MPSVMAANVAVQSSSPDPGSATNSETMKQILAVVDKKVRNMEKKKSKLDDCQARKSKGEQLNQDQLDALTKYQEIVNNLDFARDLQKSFVSLGQEIQKAVKKTSRREQLQREEGEQKRLQTVLKLQFVLDQLGDESVRRDLKRPDAGSPLLSDADLSALDELYKLVGPDRNYDVRLSDQYEEASLHLWDLVEGRDKAVAGTTYKVLKETLDKVLLSGYFDRAQTHVNGACVEQEEEQEEEQQEEQEEQPAVAESPAAEQTSQPEGTVTDTYTEPIQVETTEFVNRQLIPETMFVSPDQEQVEEWTMEAQLVNSLQPATDPPVSVTRTSPPPPADPGVRKQVVQDLMAQMQGTYNFMQDSMLEFDGQALDPAIVSAQPMKSLQTTELQLGCSSTHPDPRLPPSPPVSLPQDSAQAVMSLSEPPPAPCSLSSAFPPVSKPPHTGGINVNAAPFQSVQAVFNLNAPVPPASDGPPDPLKAGQFPGGFAQSFTRQAETPAQQDGPRDTLQVGGFQSPEVMASAGGHEESAPGPGFGQSAQPYYTSRAVPRGGPRAGRGMMNGYRGSTNGFRGGYDGYRPPFSTPPSSGYAPTQFTSTRDYSSNSYQREGYQPNYKRGAAGGARGLSRGSAAALRS